MATDEATYSEDCCWNDFLELCPIRRGEPCECACHATQRLEAEIEELRRQLRIAEGVEDNLVEALERLEAENERLAVERDRLKGALGRRGGF